MGVAQTIGVCLGLSIFGAIVGVCLVLLVADRSNRRRARKREGR